jgi:hypothetical protein
MKKIFAALLLALALTGCAQIGLQQAQSFDEKLAYSYAGIASIRSTTAASLMAGSIKLADAEQVQTLADQARTLLDSARALENSDATTANGKLLLASSILLQLQTYVAAKGVK